MIEETKDYLPLAAKYFCKGPGGKLTREGTRMKIHTKKRKKSFHTKGEKKDSKRSEGKQGVKNQRQFLNKTADAWDTIAMGRVGH